MKFHTQGMWIFISSATYLRHALGLTKTQMDAGIMGLELEI
jgi:hypothetical protein